MSSQQGLYFTTKTEKHPWAGRLPPLMCPLNPKPDPLPSPEQGGWGDAESAAAPPPAGPGERVQGAASAFHLAHGLHEAGAVGDCCRQENEPEP